MPKEKYDYPIFFLKRNSGKIVGSTTSSDHQEPKRKPEINNRKPYKKWLKKEPSSPEDQLNILLEESCQEINPTLKPSLNLFRGKIPKEIPIETKKEKEDEKKREGEEKIIN